MSALLEVKNLSVAFSTPAGTTQVLRQVDLSLKAGETLAVVGPSGCGKSTLCKNILRLLPKNAHTSGQVMLAGEDLIQKSEKELCRLRGRAIGLVFQDPMTALNPSRTMGSQLAEAVRAHGPRLSRPALGARVEELLALVGIEHPKERARLYPHHFSGGMRQRVVLAMALAGGPQILLADEPTSALDVTTQAQILELLKNFQRRQGLAMVLVTHDWGVVARVADRVAVMEAGKIIQCGTAEEIFRALPPAAFSPEFVYCKHISKAV